ncbi:MAG: hypothetical protein D3919_03790 [Candidatus Electrothrix sp. AW5]|nr:hypothetical protein [Candidatus Electrothrix gigas]
MVINNNKHNKLNKKKEQGIFNTFESFFFVTLTSLSLLFLFVTCWFFLTGDENIFFHGKDINYRDLDLPCSMQSVLPDQPPGTAHTAH